MLRKKLKNQKEQVYASMVVNCEKYNRGEISEIEYLKVNLELLHEYFKIVF